MRQVQEQSSSQYGPTEATSGTVVGSSPLVGSSLLRLNTNSLFPRNNLIDGGCSIAESPHTGLSKPGASQSSLADGIGGVSQSTEQYQQAGVRVNQLKDMRRQAFFQQEQLEFVGKLTSKQQAVRLPASNAEQIREQSTMNQNLHAQAARVGTPNRVGSSNIAFRKKKASSVIQQLPPLTKQQQQQEAQTAAQVNFRPQPYHIAKEDSEDGNNMPASVNQPEQQYTSNKRQLAAASRRHQ